MTNKRAKAWVICPDCGRKREVSKQHAREIALGYKSGRCRICGNSGIEKSKRTYPIKVQVLDNGNRILWPTLEARPNSPHGTKPVILVYCSKCHGTRWCEARRVQSGLEHGTFTGYCIKHRPYQSRGEKSGSWQGGRSHHGFGYVWLHIANLSPEDYELAQEMIDEHSHPYILEHRLVIAKHLGRPLLSEEWVHHKNEIPNDNRNENLEIYTPPEHGKLHANLRKCS